MVNPSKAKAFHITQRISLATQYALVILRIYLLMLFCKVLNLFSPLIFLYSYNDGELATHINTHGRKSGILFSLPNHPVCFDLLNYSYFSFNFLYRCILKLTAPLVIPCIFDISSVLLPDSFNLNVSSNNFK